MGDVTLDVLDILHYGKYVTVTTAGRFVVSRPGQVVKLRCHDVVQYIVLASWPCKDMQHFIVKSDSRLGHALLGSSPSELLASEPSPTSGFDVSDVQGRPCYFFAGGSGIAAIKPVMEYFDVDEVQDVRRAYYLESDGQFYDVTHPYIDIHRLTTGGVISENPAEPILGMISKLSDTSVVDTFPTRPIVFAAGPQKLVERLRNAFHGLLQLQDFRTNY